MIKNISQKKLQSIRRRLRRLYGVQAERLEERFLAMMGRYGVGTQRIPVQGHRWDQHDVLLITYGDMVQKEGEPPLVTLNRFCTDHLKGAVKVVHILPFNPWSSDDGFSVIDYREVGEDFGEWQDIEALGANFNLMFDLVLNHCSRKSAWFKDFLVGIAPGRHYFLEMNPNTDLSQVVRPRTSPLLTKTTTRFGETYVWTTFSDDQVDLNWQNPDLLFEFLDILFLYISKGMRILRLDAVAFIWKNLGTNCIHQPETHEIIKLMRDVIEVVAPHVILLTETNVPHAENVSYFGKNDEAHMVYNFSLPPLLLHALLTGNSGYLTEWAIKLEYPGKQCTFLNFSASHDGVGVRPLQGLLPEAELEKLIEEVEQRGGHVSKKANPDGSESPYELNITYASALSVPGDEPMSLRRFFCSQAVVLAFKGVPAVYFHSLIAAANDAAGYAASGIPRRLNRRKWQEDELLAMVEDRESAQGGFFYKYLQLMRRRANYPAFNPEGRQIIHSLSPDLFVLERISPLGNQLVFCLFNFSTNTVKVSNPGEVLSKASKFYDIVSGKTLSPTRRGFTLQPYQAMWLVPRE